MRRGPELVLGAVFVVLVVGYGCWVAFGLDGPVGPRVGFGTDSVFYLAAARHPVWTNDFLAGPGPFVFLLLLKACARNLRAVVLVQSCLAAGAWTYLAWTLRSTMRTRPAQLVVFTGILLLGVSPRVVSWNVFVATESISITLLCVVVAFGIRLAMGGTTRTFVAFIVALVGFGFTRDTNALTLVLIAGAVLVAAAARRIPWRRAVLTAGAAVLTVAIAMSLANAAEPPRWFWPLTETVVLRMVGDEEAEPHLVENGFPLDENIRLLHENFPFMHRQLTEGEEFRPLRDWVREDGRDTYANFLVTHPAWVIREPVEDRSRLMTPAVESYSRITFRNGPPGTYAWIGSVGWPGSDALTTIWIGASALALVGIAVVAHRKRDMQRLRVVAVIGLTGAASVFGYLAAFHGDALEVDRHSLTPAVALHVVSWAALALAIDAVRASRGRHDRRLPVRARDAGEPDREHDGLDRDEHTSDL